MQARMIPDQTDYDFSAIYARQIRGWLADLRQMTPGTRGYVQMLCYAYNWATDPARLESDREARITRRLARYCRRRLDRCTGWHRSESGRLFA